MAKQKKKSSELVGVRGRPSRYPLDKWCDGKVRTINCDKLGKAWTAVAMAVRRHGSRLGGKVIVLRTGDNSIRIQFQK